MVTSKVIHKRAKLLATIDWNFLESPNRSSPMNLSVKVFFLIVNWNHM